MSSISARNGIFYYWYYDKFGLQHKKSMKTKDRNTARRLQKIWDYQMEKKTFGLDDPDLNLDQAFASFLEHKRNLIRATTLRRYRNHIDNMRVFFSGRRIINVAHLDNDLITKYFSARTCAGAAPKTVHEEINVLRQMLKRLIENQEIKLSPITAWPKIKKVPKSPASLGFYSSEDIAKLKEYFKNKEFGPVFFWSLYTGARYSEIAAAKLSDVNLKDRIIRISNIKTVSKSSDQYRYIALHPELIKVIEPRLSGAGADPIFPEMQKHGYNWARVTMARACRDLGIPYKRFHGLRHTFATYLLAGGVDIRQAMSALGHSNLETIQKYAHLARQVADVTKLGY
jgi:integrase